jgi:hypothetical protein
MTLRPQTLFALVASCVIAAGCSGGAAAPAITAPRSYRLGFASNPPRLTVQSVLATIEAWRTHADVALISQPVPWRALLADSTGPQLVRRDLQQLAALYRSRGFPVIVQLDVTDGLAREHESPDLVAAGRSISEPAIQALYFDYLTAVDSILHPEYLGLAMETNLVRAIAPATVYSALKVMTAEGAARLAAQSSHARRFVSMQVETAWGRLPDVGHFVGIETDRADFPFIEALGLSSYPFLGKFSEPEDVPLDYYARLNGNGAIPTLVVEGGWSSASVTGVTSSPERQARYIRRQMAIADSGRLAAVTQITFTDLDIASYNLPPESILPLFAHLGLVDIDLHPKPALAEWDRALARPLQAGR